MQKLLLALVAAAGLAGLAYLLLPTETADGDRTAAAAGQAEADRERRDEAPRAGADPARPADGTEAARATDAAARGGDGGGRVEAGEGTVLRGRVELPDGLPADDRLQVWLHAEPPAAGAAPWADQGDAVEGPRAFPVASDGTFEVELPFGAERGWLQLESRYLFTSGPVALSAPAAEADVAPTEAVRVETELGAWITGRVLLPPGAEAERVERAVGTLRFRPSPLAAAGLRGVRRAERMRPTEARVAATLDFELRGLRCVARGDLEVESEAFAAAKLDGVDPRPGEHLEFELALVDGADVRGRVVDDAGRPVPEASLTASVDPLMFGQGGFEVREAVTDADGRFHLPHVTPGAVKLEASREGHLQGSLALELIDGEARAGVEVVLPTGNALEGRVQWPDGTPVVEADVAARFDLSFAGGMEAMNATRGAEGDARTDANGAFTIRGLGAGPFVLRVEAERDGRLWRARRDALRPDGTAVVLTLTEPLGVAGRVVDDLGRPLTEFDVVARTRTSGMLAGLGAETHRDRFESEEGRFFLDGLREGAWELFALAEGHARPVPTEVTLPMAEGELVELLLPRAGSASGLVLDADGFPVPGAAVAVRLGLEDIGRIELEGLPPSTETDEEGRFLLAGLPSDRVELIASAPGFGDSEAVAVELAPGGTTTEVLLTLRVGGRILGLLLDDDGDPVAGESVLCQDPADPTSQRFSSTDGNGEFVIADLAPGTYQVMTFGAGGDAPSDEEGLGAMLAGMKFTMAEVKEGQDTHVTLGAAPSDPVEVQGTVTLDGEPVAGAMVTFMADGNVGMDQLKFVTTGKQGRFATTLDRPGRYLMNVQEVSGSGQQQTVELLETIPDVDTHTLEIELPIGVIAGRVTTPGGEPAAGVRVSLAVDGPLPNGSLTGGQYAEITTEADGTYELRWLRPASYTVAAGGSFLGGLLGDVGGKSWGRQVRRGIELGAGQRLTGVDFRLEEPGRLEGRVVDAGGAPIADAAVFLRDEEGNVVDRISMVRTDRSGRFVYAGLQPGGYEVTARTSEAVSSEPTPVVVRGGEPTEVALSVEGGTLLLVSLTDREGEPVRCSVTVIGPDGRQVNGLFSYTDLMEMFSSGGFSTTDQRVGPLPPGKYTIEATAADGRDARKVVALAGQEQRRVRLRLD